THAVRDRAERVFREVVVADLRRGWRWLLLLHAGLEAKRKGPDVHGPAAAEGSRLRPADLQVGDRALDANSLHDVRGRSSAGRGPGFGGRRFRKLRLRDGHREDPD